ncbi:MAG: hypothetical protein DYG88_07195 [Chloroflexi bacterium CFX4]|nr:hypothetical protein [Chloroflexi bacterium CFX4]MDL1922002.1 hypothetical protein [Chloroflexi bacterium CFX3]
MSIYRPGDQTFYLRYTQAGLYHEHSIRLDYALSGDIPVVGDWDGDGYTNVGVYRPSTAQFLLTTSETAVVCAPDHTITYGNLGALPLAGKWTGGAAADSIGVWQDGVFAFRQSLTDASTTHKTYGNSTDTPLVGNWAGDGVDRPAVWRNGQGMFYLDNNDVTQTVLFGNPNDTPLAGDWDGNGVDGVGVRRDTPRPTRTPTLEPTPTSLPTAYPIMENGRLTNCEFEPRVPGGLPSRDVNPLGSPVPALAYAPLESAEVMIVDVVYEDATQNQGLGKFVAIRVDSNLLTTACNRQNGWYYIGYAHLSSVLVSEAALNPPFPLVPSALHVGMTGTTGMDNVHLDVTVFWLPKTNRELIETFEK